MGLGAEVDRQGAKRARGNVVVLAALIAGVLIVFSNRGTLFPGMGTYVRIGTVAALVVLGWWMARSLGLPSSAAWTPARPASSDSSSAS